jgi:hypothetical protein
MRSRRVFSWSHVKAAVSALGILSLVIDVGAARAQSASTHEGTLEILHDDTPAGSRFEYLLHTNNGRFSLRFAGAHPTHLLTRARIRVKGVQTSNTLALGPDTTTSVQTVIPAPLINTLGEQRTLLILVNFSDAPTQPYTPDYARQRTRWRQAATRCHSR